MANIGLKGRVVFADTGQGVSGLTVHAVDEHTLPDHDLGKAQTDSNGNFQLNYGPGGYTRWEGELNPNIRVRIYGPVKRVLYDRKFEDVTDSTLDLQEIRIHTNNVAQQTGADDRRAWLVTNATLNPETGDPVNLSEGNTFKPLIDGAELFPRVIDVAAKAKSSINFMNLNFRIGHNLEAMRARDFLITKFDEGFDFRSPPLGEPVDGEMIQQIMLDKVMNGVAVRVIVADIALKTDDAPNQVLEFFQDSEVETRVADYGIEVLHGRTVIVDGKTAFVIGSSFDQNYFSSPPHEIRDARHRGSLLHDVAAEITGPAVVPIEETFVSVWNEADITDQISAQDRIEGTGGIGLQVLRTLPGDRFNAPVLGGDPIKHGETSVLEAYQRAIARAEKLIYIEDQYFTNSAIVDALIDRMNAVPTLQLIIVLNIKPDFYGYPRKQIKISGKCKRRSPIRRIGSESLLCGAHSFRTNPIGPKNLSRS
jgi:phosphatidylserine/phosphatidylglycerophosphate/cardiolipin synthase-like enzyme